MQKIAIPVVVLGLVVAGLFMSGILGGDPEPTPRDRGTQEEAATDNPEIDVSPAGSTRVAPSGATGAAGRSDAPTIEIDAAGAGSIEGRVVDESGVPVEGAVVHLAMEPAGDARAWQPTRTPDLTDDTGRSATDVEGRFRYEGLAEDQSFTLFVRADGWVGERRRGVPSEGDPVEFILEAGESVRGIVLDPRQRPVAGAQVQAGPTMTRLGESMYIPVGVRFDQDALMPVAESGPDGSFSLAGIPSGEFSLGASHDQFGPSDVVNLMQSQDGLTLELRPNTGIEGRILDPNGRPVAGATVRTRSFGFWEASGRRGSTVETDEAGLFRLEGLSPGDHRLLVTADGFPPLNDPDPIGVGEGEFVTDVEIVLARGASIRGIVIGADGAPVEGASVSLVNSEYAFGMRRIGTRDDETHRTDSTGAFRLDGLSGTDEGSRMLRIEHDLHSAYEGDPLALAPGSEIDLGTIALFEAVVITGRIQDVDGAPIADARVSLKAATGSEEQDGFMLRTIEYVAMDGAAPIVISGGRSLDSTRSDVDGKYRLKIEQPGEFHVAARAKGFQRSESDPVAVGDRSVEGIVLTLFPALQITGNVVDELGAPCPEVSVFARRERMHENTKTDASGGFVIDGLDEGTFRVGLASEGWSLAEEAPEVDSGTAGLTLVARRPGRVEGRIIDQVSGRPITEFSLQTTPDFSGLHSGGALRYSPMGMGGVEYRDPEGRFAIEDLSPGTHKITVRAPNMVEQAVNVEVASGRTTETLVELERAGSISGRVLDTAGNPIAGAQVVAAVLDEDGNEKDVGSGDAMRQMAVSIVADISIDGAGGQAFSMISGGGPSPAVSDENGEFRIEGLADGEVKVKFKHDEYRDAVRTPIAVRRGEDRDIGTTELIRGATLRGSVRTTTGQPLMWTAVHLEPAEAGSGNQTSPDGEGNFTLGGLDAGTYQVKVVYMVQPEGEMDFSGMHRLTHEVGAVRLETDEVRTLDIVLPVE